MSSSREARIRVPFLVESILVGEPSTKKGKRAMLGDLTKAGRIKACACLTSGRGGKNVCIFRGTSGQLGNMKLNMKKPDLI